MIGDWDKVTINYGYREFPAGSDDKAALQKILDDAWAEDLRYFTNQDTDIHPRVDQWSNGVNQADELDRLMEVRRSALDRIGEQTIRTGAPMATVEEALVPIYMYHRYAVEGAASMIAGQDFIYAMRGDGRTPVKWESAANQRKALEALAATLKPSELVLPKKILDAIPPRPPGYGMHRELFPRTTGEAFDPIAPGAIAADVTIGFVLQGDRASRMVAQHAVDPALPSLGEVIDRFVKATFDATTATPVRGRGAARRRARAGGPAAVAGAIGRQRPGAGHRVVQARAAGGAAARASGRGRRGRPRQPVAAGRRHQAVPRTVAGRGRKDDARGRRAPGCADWRRAEGVAGAPGFRP